MYKLNTKLKFPFLQPAVSLCSILGLRALVTSGIISIIAMHANLAISDLIMVVNRASKTAVLVFD